MCPWKSHLEYFWTCWYLLSLILRKELWMKELLSTRQFKLRNSRQSTRANKAYNSPNIAESNLCWQQVATSVPGVAIGAQAVQIMPKHCSGEEDSLTSGRNTADVMHRLGRVLLMYQVCPVHKGQQSLAPAGNLTYPGSRKCCKSFPSW